MELVSQFGFLSLIMSRAERFFCSFSIIGISIGSVAQPRTFRFMNGVRMWFLGVLIRFLDGLSPCTFGTVCHLVHVEMKRFSALFLSLDFRSGQLFNLGRSVS